MTHKEYNKLVTELQRRGYRKYPSPRGSKDDWAWYKSFGESKHQEGRSNYQVCFDVTDFSPYAYREPYFHTKPYCIEPQILISRTINERIDLNLSYIKVDDTNIDEIERLAESFFKWIEKEVEA